MTCVSGQDPSDGGRLVAMLRVKVLNFQKTLREQGKTERSDDP
jgi:hypothetical protein